MRSVNAIDLSRIVNLHNGMHKIVNDSTDINIKEVYLNAWFINYLERELT